MNLEKALKKLELDSSIKDIETNYNNRINKLINDIEKYKKLKRVSYEDWKFEKITKEEFTNYSSEYDKQVEIINNEISSLETVYLQNIKNQKRNDYWIEHFKRNKKVRILTKEIIDELVEKILVSHDNKVTISFKYQDEFEQALKFIESKGENEQCQNGKLQHI
ncbi:MAG: hypothetical protein ACK5LZ_01025 [Anaerorhabdus sp.]